ncbi:Regulator of phospholipase D SRF1 [Cyberlindnera fabianii]|uniref:Regulator of phospholipase D SRF1 n=1 Tax=Cyberlindnera fabianii TaxID=36022 RepID=A0A1V2LD44_CYBFA|nr:Regulator of phospholipase D SRF1 [Cyberlindnera fabianii]
MVEEEKDHVNGIPSIEIEDVDLNNDNGSSLKSRQLPSVQLHKSESKSFMNPYSNISNYSHEASTVPPYVLYGIANSAKQQKIQEKPFKVVERKDNSTQVLYQDPFISAMGGDWSNFFQTVDSTPAFADGVLYRDAEALSGLPDLTGSWGGDERLKICMNQEGVNPYEKNDNGWFLSSGSSSVSTDTPPKRKSKAKYWMSTQQRENWSPYLKRVFLFNNYVPLFFRIFTIILSVIALALSIRIFRISKRKVQLSDEASDNSEVSQQPSTLMAICVQSIGLLYLFYIARDEFNSKPLGIRNPVAKMRLILFDLLFIIFSSANLALSFNTLYDSRWVCAIDSKSMYPRVESICRYQKALSAFLFIILVTWVVTFSISIMRVILKVSSSSGPGH